MLYFWVKFAKIRFREEKSEHLAECREDLEHTKSILNKLRIESQAWCSEARKTAAYRDEVDALRERAERADRFVFIKFSILIIV